VGRKKRGVKKKVFKKQNPSSYFQHIFL